MLPIIYLPIVTVFFSNSYYITSYNTEKNFRYYFFKFLLLINKLIKQFVRIVNQEKKLNFLFMI